MCTCDLNRIRCTSSRRGEEKRSRRWNRGRKEKKMEEEVEKEEKEEEDGEKEEESIAVVSKACPLQELCCRQGGMGPPINS